MPLSKPVVKDGLVQWQDGDEFVKIGKYQYDYNQINNLNEGYKDYLATATQYGAKDAAVGIEDFAKYYNPADDRRPLTAKAYQETLYPVIAKQYNQSVQDYAKKQGTSADPNQLLSETWLDKEHPTPDKDDPYHEKVNESAKQEIGSLYSKLQNTNKISSQYEDTHPTLQKFLDTNPDAKTAYDDIKATIAKGQDTFTKPEFDSSYVDKWTKTLQEIEQPSVDWATQQLNKQVQNTYNFSNPYSVGSGTEVTASQDATNSLLQSVLANRNAQSLALGQADYNMDYGKALADFQYQNDQYNAAKATMLNIAGQQAGQQRQDYYSGLSRNWALTDMANQQTYDQSMLYQQQAYAQQIAANYQPQSSGGSWGGAAAGAASGAAAGTYIMPGWGTAIGGLVGGVAGYFGGGYAGGAAGSTGAGLYNMYARNRGTSGGGYTPFSSGSGYGYNHGNLNPPGYGQF